LKPVHIYPIILRCILILFSHLRLDLPDDLFLPGFLSEDFALIFISPTLANFQIRALKNFFLSDLHKIRFVRHEPCMGKVSLIKLANKTEIRVIFKLCCLDEAVLIG
jgi:hypothetical protein